MEPIKLDVLDHGFVSLIDVMGEDATPALDARTSRGHQGERRLWKEDERLIRFMWENKHTTPFEMIETKWLCKMPIFVARQWIRHRTASITEFSMRYSDASQIAYDKKIEYYTPKEWRGKPTTSNLQGSSEGVFHEEAIETLTETYCQAVEYAIDVYEELLINGVAYEMARMVLPVSVYTEWVWKIDLWNLLHFLEVRTHPDAQWEMQQYAKAMKSILIFQFPLLMRVVG